MELATLEKTLFELEPISRTVPTTITRITASMTAYSAMSWPSSCDQSLLRKSFIVHPLGREFATVAPTHSLPSLRPTNNGTFEGVTVTTVTRGRLPPGGQKGWRVRTCGLTPLEFLANHCGDAQQTCPQQTQRARLRDWSQIGVAAGQHDRDKVLATFADADGQLHGQADDRNILIPFDQNPADGAGQSVFLDTVDQIEELPGDVPAETAGENHAVGQALGSIGRDLERAATGESSAPLQAAADQCPRGKTQGP